MERVFADTGYWIALLNPRDELHPRAMEFSRTFGLERIVTSEMVLTEFLNGLSPYGPYHRQAAARAVESLRASGAAIVAQTPQLFAQALSRYRAMADKSWSLTDCASFLIMEAEHLSVALTHDGHFAQAGFQALLR
ncbi:MAG: PIN domain-containing protein [Acidobacteriaceae bacterium]